MSEAVLGVDESILAEMEGEDADDIQLEDQEGDDTPERNDSDNAPEAVSEETQDEPVEASAQTEQTEAQVEDKQETAKEQETVPEDDAEILQEKLRIAEERAEHWKKSHDTLSGKNSAKVAKLQERLDRLESARTDDEDPFREQSPVAAVTTSPEQVENNRRLAEYEQRENLTLAQEAAMNGAKQWQEKFPFANATYSKELGQAILERNPEIEQVIKSGTPKEVELVVREILMETYDGIRSKIETGRVESSRKQVKEIVSHKNLNGPVSGSNDAGEGNLRNKDMNDLTDEELETLMNKDSRLKKPKR